MIVHKTSIVGLLTLVPERVHRDDRGIFARTFDAASFRAAGVDPASFVQDSQSRSFRGVLRGLHGRCGLGETKLVRCARGAVFFAVVDARPGSPTHGAVETFRLDDEEFAHLHVPPGMLAGWQALTDVADVCYRMDREHDPREDVAVRYDDPDLAVAWPLPPVGVSARDAAAPSWAAFTG